MSKKKGSPSGAPAGAPDDAQDRGRFSVRRKTEAVLRVLKGETLDAVSRDVGVTAARLASWRDAFIASGTCGLKSRPTTPEEDEVKRLQHLIGEMTIDQHILKARLKQLEDPASPFARRRPTP